MSMASNIERFVHQNVWTVGNVLKRTRAVHVPLKPEAKQLFCKEMSIITLSKITENLESFEYNSVLLIYLTEDNWNIEGIVLAKNEIFINRPFFHVASVRNSIIVQDEQGFKYHKSYSTKDYQHWECVRRRSGCKSSIKTRGDTIILQRNEHTHNI